RFGFPESLKWLRSYRQIRQRQFFSYFASSDNFMNQSASHETKSFFSADKKLLFILLCLLSLLLLYIKIAFIEHETAAFEFLQDRPEGFILKVISGLKFLS